MTYRTFDGTAQTESVTLGRYSSSKSGVSDGSTTQGAVYFSDDVDTGFYSPANDKIALITGGVERLHIDDSGNVGIGAAPGTKFEINGSAPYLTLKNDTHEDTDGGRESKIIFEGEQSGGEITTLAQIQASHDGSSDDEKGDLIFSINDGNDAAAPSEVIRITSDKRVGIGSTAPGTQFEVNGANPYVTLKNTAAEDTDHGREAKLIFEGIQSGAEESTLGEIVVSHYGSADDQKGEIFFNVNDGSDGTSPTTVLKLNSDGHVGIGETNPGVNFHVKESDTGIAPHSSSQICLEREGTNYLQFLTAETGTSGLLFGDGSDVDVAKIVYDHNVPSMQFVVETATALTIHSDKDVEVEDGDLIIGTAGHGIDFAATANASGGSASATSELLDDYEEGTFTPKLKGSVTGDTYNVTGGGHYTKVGRMVHVTIRISNVDLNNSADGIVQLGDLPFTPSDYGSPSAYSTTASWNGNNVGFNTSGHPAWYASSTNNAWQGIISTNGGGWANWDVDQFIAGTTYMNFSGTYVTAT